MNHPSEHPDYPEHFQPSALKVQMTPKAAREILDYLEKQERIKGNHAPTNPESLDNPIAEQAADRLAGAMFVLKALGVPRNHVKWTAEIK